MDWYLLVANTWVWKSFLYKIKEMCYNLQLVICKHLKQTNISFHRKWNFVSHILHIWMHEANYFYCAPFWNKITKCKHHILKFMRSNHFSGLNLIGNDQSLIIKSQGWTTETFEELYDHKQNIIHLRSILWVDTLVSLWYQHL